MNKPGTLNVIYFVHPSGYVTLAPSTSFSPLPGCIRETANTLAEVDRLQKRLVEQERRQLERESRYEESTFGAKQDEIRDKLYARLASSVSTQYEKDFIREYLKLRDERKRHKHAQILEHAQMYLHAREFDSRPNRKSDSEEFRSDSIDVRS